MLFGKFGFKESKVHIEVLVNNQAMDDELTILDICLYSIKKVCTYPIHNILRIEGNDENSIRDYIRCVVAQGPHVSLTKQKFQAVS